MPEFHVTFGSRYGAEAYGADPHPILGYEYCHRDGWLTVEAPAYDVARSITTALLWTAWSNLYGPEDFDPSYFPRGELLRLRAGEPIRLPEAVLDRLWTYARARSLTIDRESSIKTLSLNPSADSHVFYSSGPRVWDDASGGVAVVIDAVEPEDVEPEDVEPEDVLTGRGTADPHGDINGGLT